MKNYNEFLTEVKEGILTIIPDNGDLEVKINKVTKTNNIVLDGLSIIKTNNDLCISPTIYLNGFYTQYQEGKSFNEILTEIASLHLLNKDNKPSFNLDLDNRDNVIVNVVNKDMNEELLKETPHLEFQDLAIVFRYLAKQASDGIGTILLKNNLLGDTDLNSLYDIALANTKRLFGINIRTMREVMADMFRNEGCPDEIIELMAPEDTLPMYVITNNISINGATIILMNDVWSELANRLDSDLYLLPSSIHELLAIPTTFASKPQELKEMVENVNVEQVAIEERLSDNVYIYKRATNQIELC